MKLFERLRKSIKRNSVAVKISIGNAFALFLLCYFVDNSPYSFLCDATLGQHVDQAGEWISPPPSEKIQDELLFVNVAYDRELAEIKDEFGFAKGNIDITDRTKLLNFLSQLKNSDYRYIILDVRFADEYSAPQDSALFNTIHDMENIVVAKSDKFELASPLLLGKAYYTDYSYHILESNFVKYEFIRNGEPTIPYKVYMDLYGDSISSFAGFYFFNGKLANKSVVLRYPITLWNEVASNSDAEDSGMLQYYNLGSDVLDLGVDVPSLAKGKIVVIGDFTENDMHATYMGPIAGPIININAFYALVNDDLSIPYLEIIFLLILYFAISLYLLKEIDFSKYIPWLNKIKSATFHFVLSLIGLPFVLTFIAFIWYIVWGIDINILIPSFYFSMFGLIIKFRKSISNSKS